MWRVREKRIERLNCQSICHAVSVTEKQQLQNDRNWEVQRRYCLYPQSHMKGAAWLGKVPYPVKACWECNALPNNRLGFETAPSSQLCMVQLVDQFRLAPRLTWFDRFKLCFEKADSWLTSSDQLPAWRGLTGSSYALKRLIAGWPAHPRLDRLYDQLGNAG